MKNYTYTGTSILAFSDQGKDYVVFGKGPHELPEDNQMVKNLVSRKILKATKKLKKSS